MKGRNVFLEQSCFWDHDDDHEMYWMLGQKKKRCNKEIY
jgi:hypothetical protein